jgi:hypothetical protein
MAERYPGAILSCSHTGKHSKLLPGVSRSIPTLEINDFATIIRGKVHHHPAGHQNGQQFMNLHSFTKIHTQV